MIYFLEGHDRGTALQELLISLLPDEEHVSAQTPPPGGVDFILSHAEMDGNRVAVHCTVRRGGLSTSASAQEGWSGGELERRRALTHAVKDSAYRALLPHLAEKPAWGGMTGVKPAKPVRLALERGLPPQQAEGFLQKRYDVDPKRSAIAAECASEAEKCLKMLDSKEIQLYVGIPFCPAKCRYCSFVSNDVKRFGALVEPYLEALHAEIAAAGQALTGAGYHVGSLYIGGGTPTTLAAGQLDRLLDGLHRAFDFRSCREKTVEAGRPETISRERMAVCAQWGVGRVSVNPQTMRDDVLAAVGRCHTADDIRRAYADVRAAGNFIVNMDLIAGLPGDDAEGLLSSVRQVSELEPENITLHSLALKKGAQLRFGPRGVLDRETVDQCHELLRAGGWRPYYLYRQKYIAGGLENVGFCKGETASFYNVCMMEEIGSVAALGAGGVTKLCGGGKIRRVANPKYPLEYIRERERIIARAASLDEKGAPGR